MNSTVRVTRAEIIILSTMKGSDREAVLIIGWVNHSTFEISLGNPCNI